MQFYNVHSHVFNIRNAPKRFLNLFLPDLGASLVDRLTNTVAGATMFEFLLSKFVGNLGKRYASFLQVGKSRNQGEIFENLKKQYDDPNLKVVALTMYMEKCGAGASETGYEGQLEGIIEVKRQYPDNLLVFLGIDPRWKNTGAELKETVEKYFETKIQINAGRSVFPFVGLKIYPSLGFYVFDEKLKETFAWAAENGVPVLSHCSYLGGLYNNDVTYVKNNLDPIDCYRGVPYSQTLGRGKRVPVPDTSTNVLKWILGQNDNHRNLNTCSYFLEPESYRSLLEHFKANEHTKSLKLCLAHFGGEEHVMDEFNDKQPGKFYSTLQKNWCAQIKGLIKEFPDSVYTDIAYAVGRKETHQAFFSYLKVPELQDRMMFGTDFFLTERLLPEKDDYGTFKTSAIDEKIGTSNAWEIMASKNTETFLTCKYYP